MVFVSFWTRTRTSFEDRQLAIRCRHSVTFPSRGELDLLLQAWLVLWVVLLEQYKCSVVLSPNTLVLVVAGKDTSVTLLTLMVNCSFSVGAKLPTCRNQALFIRMRVTSQF